MTALRSVLKVSNVRTRRVEDGCGFDNKRRTRNTCGDNFDDNKNCDYRVSGARLERAVVAVRCLKPQKII